MKSALKDQTGSAAVEFAVILPLLFLLLFGIIEFGVMFYDKAMITNAAREGARNGILSQSPRVVSSRITDVVQNYVGTGASNLISFADPKPNVTIVTKNNDSPCSGVTPCCTVFEDNLKVTVTYPYNYLYLPFGSTTLKGEAVMKCE